MAQDSIHLSFHGFHDSWVQSQFSWVIYCFTRLKFRCGSGATFLSEARILSELTDYWLNSVLCGCGKQVPIFPVTVSQHLLSAPREPWNCLPHDSLTNFTIWKFTSFKLAGKHLFIFRKSPVLLKGFSSN